MDLITVIVCGLAGWRLANLLLFEDGPLSVFGHFRKFIGIKPGPIEGFLPTLFSCIYCLSLYASLLVYGIYVILPEAAMIIAIAAVIILVDRAAKGE